jgi:hypothetical protein
MTSKKFWLVMLVIILALGMTVLGCNKGAKSSGAGTTESDSGGSGEKAAGGEAAASKTSGGTTGGSGAAGSDGWTAVARLPFRYISIKGIAWGNDKFVAVGRTDNLEGKISYSSDGVTWAGVNDSSIFSGTGDINAVAYGGGKFVAVGWGNNGGKIAYSSDGVTWTAVSDSTFGNSQIEAVAWGNNKFVAIGGYNDMAYSSDGVTWTAVGVSSIFSGTSGEIHAIAYGGGMFVAIGRSGNSSNLNGIIATSTDGISWTAVTTTALHPEGSPYPATIEAIAWGNGIFVAGGQSGKMVTSKNGTSWTAVDVSKIFGTDSNESIIRAIAWGGGKFVAVGYNGEIATSTNGTSWAAVTTTAFDYKSGSGSTYKRQFESVAYGNGKFVAGAGSIIGYTTGK